MIEHTGIIEKITGNRITVRILQESACSACHAKGACMAADSKEKIVDVTDNSGKFLPNEHVIIQGKESMAYQAILWAFVIPLLILIAVLILTTSVWHMSEFEAAILAIISLTPYYIILYILRHKMAKTFTFTIKKQIKRI